MNFKAMFEDQRAFNRQVWTDKDGTEASFRSRLKDLSLGMVEETLEFLRTYEWKAHRRRQGKLQNVAHSHEELIDMLKYWMGLADLADFPFDRLEEFYYAKSRVVQYRYQEEWLQEINGPCVLVDIDNVLADYITGICTYARENAQKFFGFSNVETVRFVLRLDELQKIGRRIDAESVGINETLWRGLKHEFRITGEKRRLPIFADAKPFLNWCREQKWMIILVTSRPIDRYPNIFTDTVTWLHENELPFDFLWWADDKALRMEEYEHLSLRSHAVFAVDDHPRFVAQYRSKGVKTYWLNRFAHDSQLAEDPTTVRSLTSLMEKEKEMAHVL